MLASLASRNALRNHRRSALTAATVTLGCALLIIASSWLLGIQHTLSEANMKNNGKIRIVTEAYGEREALFPTEEHIPELGQAVEAIAALPGIDAVYPRILQPVAASHDGEEVGEVFGLLSGAPLEYYGDVLELDRQLHSGAFFSGDGTGQALVGMKLAAEMGISPGQEAIFLGQTQDGSISPIKATVAGIVDAGNILLNRQAYVVLERAQWMADIGEGATELLVFGDGEPGDMIADLEGIAPALVSATGAVGADGNPVQLSISSWLEREPFSSIYKIQSLVNRLIIAVIVFVTALGILNTMMMCVLERTKEIGVLRAMGMTRKEVSSLLLLEAGLISALGGLLGGAAGSAAAIWMQSQGIELGSVGDNVPEGFAIQSTIYPIWTFAIAGRAFLLALAMGLLGAALPALRAIKIQPVEAMRTGS
jgi:putative ABC transport system permease protein